MINAKRSPAFLPIFEARTIRKELQLHTIETELCGKREVNTAIEEDVGSCLRQTTLNFLLLVHSGSCREGNRVILELSKDPGDAADWVYAVQQGGLL